MFTGIIEAIGKISALKNEGSNLYIQVSSSITHLLKVDQSVAHNGVCLTVVEIKETEYVVVAVKETLDKTNIGELALGGLVNLERAIALGSRLDGHIVQGHVDQKGTCVGVKELEGSWVFDFSYDSLPGNITIEKGSITINGVSLTVVNSRKNSFSVAVIPYTYENTNFNLLKVGSCVNLEFDVIGKYLKKLSEHYF